MSIKHVISDIYEVAIEAGIQFNDYNHYIPIIAHVLLMFVNIFCAKHWHDEKSFGRSRFIIQFLIFMFTFLTPYKYLVSSFQQSNFDFGAVLILFFSSLFIILTCLDSHSFCLYIKMKVNIFNTLNDWLLALILLAVNYVLLSTDPIQVSFLRIERDSVFHFILITFHTALIFFNLIVLKCFQMDEFTMAIYFLTFMILVPFKYLLCSQVHSNFDFGFSLIILFIFMNIFFSYKHKIYAFLSESLLDTYSHLVLFSQSLLLFLFLFIDFYALELNTNISHFIYLMIKSTVIFVNLFLLKYIHYNLAYFFDFIYVLILFRHFLASFFEHDLDFIAVNCFLFVVFCLNNKFEYKIYNYLEKYIFAYINPWIVLLFTSLSFIEIYF